MPVQNKTADLLDQLRAFPNFEGVEEEALRWLVDRGNYHVLPKDAFVFHSGGAIDHTQILLRSVFVIRREKDGKKQETGIGEAP